MGKANRNYTAFLLALAFLCFVETSFTIDIAKYNPKIDATGRWVFEGIASVFGLYAMAIVATLIIRWKWPGAGWIVTKALNLVLLFFFPFGTAVGIYGLRKIDKENDGDGGMISPIPSPSSFRRRFV